MYVMKYFFIVIVVLFVSCDKQKKEETKAQPKEILIQVIDTTKISITVNEEKLELTKAEIDSLTIFFDLLNKDYTEKPDIAYAKSQICNFDGFEKQKLNFESEVGQDNFYIWYAYFLQQKNGLKPHEALRTRLLNIFRAINKLNSRLQYGGTYFGHQISRINGYVEYEVYRSIDDDWYKKEYNIDKQKMMFLQSLRQHVLDEEDFDYDTLGKEKIKRREELLKIIDEIGSNIITFYDLRKAQEFQYSYYNWL
jgi:hypothetical protein